MLLSIIYNCKDHLTLKIVSIYSSNEISLIKPNSKYVAPVPVSSGFSCIGVQMVRQK